MRYQKVKAQSINWENKYCEVSQCKVEFILEYEAAYWVGSKLPKALISNYDHAWLDEGNNQGPPFGVFDEPLVDHRQYQRLIEYLGGQIEEQMDDLGQEVKTGAHYRFANEHRFRRSQKIHWGPIDVIFGNQTFII